MTSIEEAKAAMTDFAKPFLERVSQLEADLRELEGEIQLASEARADALYEKKDCSRLDAQLQDLRNLSKKLGDELAAAKQWRTREAVTLRELEDHVRALVQEERQRLKASLAHPDSREAVAVAMDRFFESVAQDWEQRRIIQRFEQKHGLNITVCTLVHWRDFELTDTAAFKRLGKLPMYF